MSWGENDELKPLMDRARACGVRDTDHRGAKRVTVEAVVERLEELTAELAALKSAG